VQSLCTQATKEGQAEEKVAVSGIFLEKRP
jgi:hypothetical protein